MKTDCCECECDTPVRERDPATVRPGDNGVSARDFRRVTRSGATAVAEGATAPPPAAPAPAAPPSDADGADPSDSRSVGLAASLALQVAALFLLARRADNPRAKPGLILDRAFVSFVNAVAPGGDGPSPAPTLIESLESIAGVAASHYVDANLGVLDSGGAACDADERCHTWQDQKAGEYHYVQGAANKGGVYRATGIGTGPSLQFLKTNTEWMTSNKNVNAGTPNMYPVGRSTTIILATLGNTFVPNSSTLRFNGAIWAAADYGTAGGVAPALHARYDSTNRGGMHHGSGGQIAMTSANVAYDAPKVFSLRNGDQSGDGKALGIDKTVTTAAGDTAIASLAKKQNIGFGADYFTGHIGLIVTFPALLSDAQVYDIVDAVRAAWGLAPVADP